LINPQRAGFSLSDNYVVTKLPAVKITSALQKSLEDDGFDVADYLQYFAKWKADWPANEYSDPFFGKDGEYDRPLRGGKRILRHVHLPPEADENQVERWEKLADRNSRKTSDTALIYAEDRAYGYLLIAILKEPRGHDVPEMETPKAIELMEWCADIADHFQMTGAALV
jgi:hypothetical protein